MLLRAVEAFLFKLSTSMSSELRSKKGRLIAWLFVTKLLLTLLNTMLMTVRESLIVSEGKGLQSKLMVTSTAISMIGQSVVASFSSQYGAFASFQALFQTSCLVTLLTYISHQTHTFTNAVTILFYLYHTFFNMTCVSLYWTVAGDALGEDASAVFGCFVTGAIAAGGTAGQFTGAIAISYFASSIGAVHTLVILSIIAVLGSISIRSTENRVEYDAKIIADQVKSVANTSSTSPVKDSAIDDTIDSTGKSKKKNLAVSRGVLGSIIHELQANATTIRQIWSNRLLQTAFLYAICFSCTVGLNILERSSSAKRIGLSKDSFAGALGHNQIFSTMLQFLIQLVGTSSIIAYLGPSVSLSVFALIRLCSFSLLLWLQLTPHSPYSQWYYRGTAPVVTVLWFDATARLVNASVSKISKESMWTAVPLDFKYRAKMVIDVFAYRLGTGLAAIVGSLPIVETFPVWLEGTQSHIVAGCVMCVVWLGAAGVMGREIERALVAAKKSKLE